MPSILECVVEEGVDGYYKFLHRVDVYVDDSGQLDDPLATKVYEGVIYTMTGA
jgi:hypothetical protein